VHIDQVTAIVEDERPLTAVGLPEIGPVQQAIGTHVAELIPDGATIQFGFGAIPDAVVMQLTDRKDLGVHTEMIGDGILTLVEAGVVTNRLKTAFPGKSVATFALGSERLYRWMHRNRGLEMHPVDVTNDPYLAGSNDLLHTINATIEVDLAGQCCSESMGYVPYSGTGGQSDFVRAANRSRGGKSFIVTPSTAKGDTVSRIVPTLKPGAHVSTLRNDVSHVVTEHGAAHLRGKTNAERPRRSSRSPTRPSASSWGSRPRRCTSSDPPCPSNPFPPAIVSVRSTIRGPDTHDVGGVRGAGGGAGEGLAGAYDVPASPPSTRVTRGAR